MTISDDRLTSPKFLAFMEKLLAPHYWTAEDYDSIPDELVVEIYDGGIYVVPSPTFDHQMVAGDLLVTFREAVGRRRVVADFDANVLGKIYKPDLLVLRHISEQQPMPGELVELVVEIISPNENVERGSKMKAYAAQGIPLYIIVDGKAHAHFAEVYRLNGEEYELRTTVPADARMEFAEPFPFVLDMTQINS